MWLAKGFLSLSVALPLPYPHEINPSPSSSIPTQNQPINKEQEEEAFCVGMEEEGPEVVGEPPPECFGLVGKPP